jgi:hypothetical protein
MEERTPPAPSPCPAFLPSLRAIMPHLLFSGPIRKSGKNTISFRIYKFRSLQEPPAKPAHLQLVPSAMDSVTSNHIFKGKNLQKEKKNEELC